MLTLFLGGDAMVGRGIDQILPRPVHPRLYEAAVNDARDYVRLAAQKNGEVPAPAGVRWIWGDAAAELVRHEADVRIVNLETAVTSAGRPWPGKGIHYRVSPENAAVLRVLPVDACVLANNHVLDWGTEGLEDTFAALDALGIRSAGAGKDLAAASAHVVLEKRGHRVLLTAACTADSGVPEAWRARTQRPGVNLLSALDDEDADGLAAGAAAERGPNDVVIVSLHWGSNWGEQIPASHVRFAHRLIDGGVDVVHGHSSHHPRAVERYGRGLVLYGCGELIDDYEGIDGFEPFRSDLVLLFFVGMNDAAAIGDRAPPSLRMTPMRIRRMRLERASRLERELLTAQLTSASRVLGSHVELSDDGDLVLR